MESGGGGEEDGGGGGGGESGGGMGAWRGRGGESGSGGEQRGGGGGAGSSGGGGRAGEPGPSAKLVQPNWNVSSADLGGSGGPKTLSRSGIGDAMGASDNKPSAYAELSALTLGTTL